MRVGLGEDKIALGNHPSRVVRGSEIQPPAGSGKRSLPWVGEGGGLRGEAE